LLLGYIKDYRAVVPLISIALEATGDHADQETVIKLLSLFIPLSNPDDFTKDLNKDYEWSYDNAVINIINIMDEHKVKELKNDDLVRDLLKD
jgi:hypothetical protein